MGFELELPLIGYTNGLAIAALLLLIVLCLPRASKAEPLPRFCADCANVRRRTMGGALYCRMRCKYNPPYKHSASKTHFLKR